MDNRKDQVEEARKELKTIGFKAFFIDPTVAYWKQQPIQALSLFLFWVLITYTLFSGLQAMNYEFMYCQSNVPGYSGHMTDVYDNYVNYVNKKTEALNQKYLMGQAILNPDGMLVNDPDRITCGYNITEFKKMNTSEHIAHTGETFIRVFLKE